MANGNEPWTPERIQSLRGGLSRAEFAARVGVSPLSVYRWELPDGAPEARRPRGRIARRLESLLTPQAAPPSPIAVPVVQPAEPAADELVELLPALERLLSGEFARVESELLAMFAGGRLRTVGARALAGQALARYQLWARGDALGAFATLVPLIDQAAGGLLPPSVEIEVHVTAALLYASFDGRVFDAGKINAHVARAERLLTASADVQRFLLWLAQLFGAYVLGDLPLIEHVLSRREEINRDVRGPVLRCFAIEARLILDYFARQPARAGEDFRALLELAASSKLQFFHARALAHAARNAIDEGRPPDEVAALATRANALCREAGLAVGVHLLYVGYAEGEARFRQGRLEEADRVWQEALRFSDELHWAPGTLPFFVARSLLLTGRAAELRTHAERVTAMRCEIYPEIMAELRVALLALTDVVEGRQSSEAIDRLDEAVRRLDQESNSWTFLRRSMALVNATVAILAGDDERAERALRWAERTLDAIPAAWGSAALLALRGLRLFRAGHHHQARPLLDAAREALDAAQDRVSGALVRHLLALLAGDLGEEGAPQMLERSNEELRAVGISSFSILEQRARPRNDGTGSTDTVAGPLLEALPRLTRRGLDARRLLRELVAAAATICPGVPVRLEEIDARGATLPVEDAGPDGPIGEWIGLGDGAGRRFQLGVGRAGAGQLPALGALASVASLAIEAAALRGWSAPPAPAVEADGPVPELPGFIAASGAMRRLKHDLFRLARSRSTIIITGESGSGKEVVARALHDLSVRANRAYVAFNCAAVPRDLFEGQLFGYRKGAFTGAVADHAGVIRAAHGGTLFLDEIGELPLDVQPKLLRFLENGEIFPLGEQKPIAVDVRVIAATFRELEQLVRDGKFREDLFYRLQVVPLRVPPLRERPEDVVALARFFVEKMTPPGQQPAVLSPGALVALTAHDWPGNVRELRNVIERSLAFDPRPAVLAAEHLLIG